MTLLPVLLALALAASASLAAAAPADGTPLGALAEREWTDQFGGRGGLATHRGQPLVVVVVDARRLAQVRRWEEQLLTRFPDLPLVTVADVNESRPPELARVQAVLARRVPREVVVLIDLQREWARALELDTAAPNLLLVDQASRVTARFRGRWTAAEGERVLAAVAALRDAP